MQQPSCVQEVGMTETSLRKRTEAMLRHADVVINGGRPWDIQVKNNRLYRRVFAQGSLGFGESYMDGWWDTESLDQLITRLIKARLDERFKSFVVLMSALKAKLLNCQSVRRAYQVGEKHYNIGNDLYQRMLDSRMIYSCGYWKNAQNLDEAQYDKLDLTCRKLHLQAGQKVLDIGCGWGGTARFMAENYGVEVVGVTISTSQAELARERCRGLPIEIRVQDYRDLEGQFDRIVSIGMFEHVGYKNYRTYFQKVADLLKEDGLFLLHTIGGNVPADRTDPWIDKYIFPNGMIPSAQQISTSFEGFLVLEDWHNFGLDYDKTLMAWYNNFESAWPELKDNYDERFRRMWTYYLLSCAGSFRARDNQLWQIVLSKQGLPEGYHFPR
ncbi:MAG: cyclopropane fatty acyl phospholipid synthase [Desulfuromonadales bacterium]|nr:cyclopropane fatty acyl phospholipid synthase [Desulfuromonadales bacterium]MBN2793459.1 cyclopropane fatty acyl phospholipid synthase [Desulfuromonadales bacterium]